MQTERRYRRTSCGGAGAESHTTHKYRSGGLGVGGGDLRQLCRPPCIRSGTPAISILWTGPSVHAPSWFRSSQSRRSTDEMDDLIPATLVLALTTISFAILAARHWYRAEVAQRELARLATQHHAAGYDT